MREEMSVKTLQLQYQMFETNIEELVRADHPFRKVLKLLGLVLSQRHAKNLVSTGNELAFIFLPQLNDPISNYYITGCGFARQGIK